MLVALVVTPAEAAARPQPDLKPTTVRALSSQVAPGGLFRVRDRVRNSGRGRSGSFSMRYLLSRDRRRGRDLPLRGGRRIGRLRAGRSSGRSTRVRVPGSAAGRYWVLACADPRRRVKERREHNNCRASARRIMVVNAPTAQPPSGAAAPTVPAKPTPPAPSGPLVAAAGDLACDAGDPNYNGGEGTTGPDERCRQRHVARLVPGAAQFFALGDLQYEQGTAAQFAGSWNVDFGAFKSITRPVIGNHEYLDPAGGAKGYFDYFNGAGNATGPAGDRAKGYYSFDVGAWHVVSLNSNCGIVSCDAGAAQETWLRADLAAHPARCTAALWHHPLLSSVTDSSGHHDEPRVAPLWKALREAGAELVLNGHAHTYERFAPMTETGAPSAAGLRELVVGTGGTRHHPILPQGIYATSQKRDFTHFGLLRLRLGSGSYAWAFVDEDGVARDSGSASCH